MFAGAGAQLPTAQPRAIHRRGAAGADGTDGDGTPPRSADDVYGFLSSFTEASGAGLDQARPNDDGRNDG
jgi:hypothetical protein